MFYPGETVTYDIGEDVGIRGMTYGDGVFMAVGTAGRAARSTDGINWTPMDMSVGLGQKAYLANIEEDQTVPYDEQLLQMKKNDEEYLKALMTGINCVAWGDGTFVAVAQNGKAAYSTDKGETWSPANGGKPLWDTPTEGEIGIAYDKRKKFFLAVSDGGVAARSSENGVAASWERVNVSAGGGTIEKFAKIAWGGGHFLVGGYADSPNVEDRKGKLLYSVDGRTWLAATWGAEQMTNGWYDDTTPSNPFNRHYVIKVGMQIVYSNSTGKFLVTNSWPLDLKNVLLSDTPNQYFPE
jgi:hypothetical protein